MAKNKKELKLGAFLSTPGNHLAGWRHPDADTSSDMNFRSYLDLARIAEAAKYDTIFFQDNAAVPGSSEMAAGDFVRAKLPRTVKLEPTTLLAAIAACTSHIGLVATVTTTYTQPYNIARYFASLDAVSGGRSGWNLVTSQTEDEAGNFGLDQHVEHGLRYSRAAEYYDVVMGLWDSWEDGAFLRDKASGEYFDRTKVHVLGHIGEHFRVRGPLNVARSPQGRPVVAQAGSSEPGRELAAKTADVVFTAQVELEAARAFYADVKGRMAKYGRSPDDLKIMPGITPILGRTQQEAHDKFEALQELLPDDVALKSMDRFTAGLDLTKYPLDGPLPELPVTNSARSRQQLVIDTARRYNMTLRQIARHMSAAQGHRILIGTPDYIADQMEEWLVEDAADGFNVICNYYPGPFREFTELVIPELQRRGIFRTEYRGQTLRDHLGIPVPANRYTQERATTAGRSQKP